MNRLHTVNVAEAGEEASPLFSAIRQAMGKVPNAYTTVGSNAPAVLGQVLQGSAVLKKGTLGARRIEAINLAVSEATQCDYCVAAHTMAAKAAGYSLEQTRKLRAGTYDEDANIDALVRFAASLVKTSGTLPAEAVEGLQAAGYDDRQIIEAIYAISAILFTNMVNRVNDTPLDFPKVA